MCVLVLVFFISIYSLYKSNASGIILTHTGKIYDNSVDGSGAALNYPESVFVLDNYAYIVSSTSKSLEIINITNKSAPVHTGTIYDNSIDGSGAVLLYPRDVFVQGNYAYIASSGSHALEIIDITNKATPIHTGVIYSDFLSGSGATLNSPSSVFVLDNYAYLTSGTPGSLEIIDITNKATPVHMGVVNDADLADGPTDLFVQGNYAYIPSYYSDALVIIDITNKAAPVHAGTIYDNSIDGSGAALNSPVSVFVLDNYAYVTSLDSLSLEIINITNKSAPVHTGTIYDNSIDGSGAFIAFPNDVFVQGNYAYIVSSFYDVPPDISGNGVLEVVDISIPTAPVHLNKIFDIDGGAALDGPSSVFIQENYAYIVSNLSNSFEIINISENNPPVITRLGTTPITLNVGDSYTDAGATAFDDVGGNITADIITVNPVDINTPGTYTVTYNVTDNEGNSATEVTRTVNVEDNPPVITLLGTTPVTIHQGDTYTDAGATALDDVDLDITASIVTVNPVDINTLGTYTITYNVTDSGLNNATEVTRIVNVVDVTIPLITLVGDNPSTVIKGQTYTDAGATAVDDTDGDITASIIITGLDTIDTNTVGSYTVYYNVSDLALNPALEVTRTVNVVDNSPVITLVGDASVTIDEGTSYTDAGATALDDVDLNITASIVTVNPVDINTPGTYTVTYNITDSGGNPATEVTRIVIVSEVISSCVGCACGGCGYSLLPVAGGWSDWTPVNDGVCGTIIEQIRTCTNPTPAYNGADCSLLDGGNNSRNFSNPDCTIVPTCTDQIKNGTETEIDCGGSCPICLISIPFCIEFPEKCIPPPDPILTCEELGNCPITTDSINPENPTDPINPENPSLLSINNITSENLISQNSNLVSVSTISSPIIHPEIDSIFRIISGLSLILAVATASELAPILFRMWSLFLTALGLRKKVKPWGVVFDAITKQPLDPVYVSLQNMDGTEVTSCITDLDGRYGFLVPPGLYKIVPNKTNYFFPSKTLSEHIDELYPDLYFGEEIKVSDGEVIANNIPMDPEHFDWNEFQKNKQKLFKFYSKKQKILTQISAFFFTIGMILATIALITFTKPYNIIIFALYIIVFILQRTVIKKRVRGKIIKGEDPLSFAIIRIFSSATDVEISHKVADNMGRYFALVPNGNYYVQIEEKKSDGTYSLVYKSEPIEVKGGILNKGFVV
ncbi:MAG: immunoglobulin-like domain-containing protein [Candidatus Paceibacterota bacterium]